MSLTPTQKRVLAFLKRRESFSITDNCGIYRIGRTKVPVLTLKALVRKGFVLYEKVDEYEHTYSIKETA